MNEIGVLFKPEMIQAIRTNCKTQTRRFRKIGAVGDRLYIKETHWAWGYWKLTLKKTKYGKPKREFTTIENSDRPVLFERPEHVAGYTVMGYHKRNALFMFKKYARTWLEITEVREEWLQDITEVDAMAEGVPPKANDAICLDRPLNKSWCSRCAGVGVIPALGDNLGMTEEDCEDCDTAIKLFYNLWDSIHGNDPAKCSNANPRVWVHKFKRVER